MSLKEAVSSIIIETAIEKMKIVNGFDLMKYAQDHHYMLPAFNTTNLEMTYAIAKGLNKAKLPGYIQISSNNLRLSDPEAIVNEADAKTDPDMVADFVAQTGCDLLAVAVGNVHGLDIEPKVDLPLLEQISKISPAPLVMHGGSGIPFDIIQKAREFNLLKVNYGSDLRKAFVSTFGKAYEANHNACSVIELSIEAVENVSEKAAELVTIINS